MPTFLTEETKMLTPLDAKQYYLLLICCFCVTAWPHNDNCPSPKWNVMCRPCCEYHLIQCRCPSKGSIVGYTVPCCRNALDECDPCIIHPGCSLFENCKTCHNGTWKANDDFFVNEKYCTECRQGWSGGNCKTCGGVIQRAQGHIALESYPTNARCEWRVKVEQGRSIELRFSQLSLESDHLCRYDYVEVRDGYDVNSPVIGRFCGDQLPQPIRSPGNIVHILFTSDGYNNFDGFVLTFQESSASTSIQSPACPHLETPINAYLLPVFGLREEFKSVNYRCYPRFTLIGSQQRICLPNGTWSGTAPRCVKEHAGQISSIWCPPPAKLLNGYFRTISDTAGGAQTIEFFCKNSHILSGSHYITCLSNGSWSSQLPKCVRACREPKVSELVRQSVVKPHRLLSPHRRPSISSRYDMQDVLSAGFIPLALDRQSGNSDAVSEELPRGFHPVHTSITYKCASALYQHSGSSRRTCLKTGRWSGRHVSCSPVCGKFDGFSINNFTDAPLPWHAAIYIRSPPPHTVSSSHRPSVMTVSRQQGASEESTFWYLACSGALLSQRSVLVAAHCVVEKGEQQPIHPAHVKVVVGRRQRTPREQMKSLQQLRVSEVLVHPNFYSSPDSDVAVLKLKDKAKISTSVLPVCLPETQGGEVTAQEVYASTWMLPNDRKHPGCDACSSQTKLVQLADVSHCEREFAPERARATQINDNTLCVKSKLAPPQSPCPHYIPGITTAPAVFSSTSEGLSGHGMTHRAATAGWQLLGLESFASEETACLQHTHTLHTKVSNFRNWIKENMK